MTALNLLWTVFAFRGGRLPILGMESAGGVVPGMLWFWVVYPVTSLGVAAVAVAGTRLVERASQRGAGSGDPDDDHVVALAHQILRDEAVTRASHDRSVGTDTLTGLLDREAVDVAVAALRGSFVVALIEMDRVQRLADRRGQGAAEHLVCRVADQLRRARSGDLLARWDVDSFLLVMPGRDCDGAAAELQGLLLAIQNDLRSAGLPATLSAGVACLDGDASLQQAVGAADAAISWAAPRVLGVA
jgi:GGDEF domain-containing protein